MAQKQRRESTTVYLERTNPLAGMSIRALQSVFDAARAGDTQRLHWIFQEIEACNPVLLVCVERRAAAVSGFRWKISELSAFDGSLAAEQKDAVERFLAGIDNLVDLFEHLDLAFFRGFAHAQPIWDDSRTVRHIECLDSWKFLRRGEEWFFNPECDGFSGSVQSCADARLISVVRKRPIDYPTLAIHVRHAVGNRDWGRFLERYALPKPAVTMHPGASNADRADYERAAQSVENGQVSVWPHGSSLADFAGGSRGVDPFRNFIEHQERTTVLLATGGTLMSLAEAGTGTLAGNAQAEVWQSIVARDSSLIAQSVQRSLIVPYLEAAFPGRKISVGFGFDFDPVPTAKDMFEVAAAARSAGYRIDKAELEAKTGFTLLEEPQMPQMPSLGGVISNRAAGTPLQNDENILQNARKGLDDKTAMPTPTPSQNAFFAAFTEGNNQLAQEVKKLLANPSPEAAKALLEKLPELLKDDPALAALIAEEMAKEFEGVGAVEHSECEAEYPATCPTHGVRPDKAMLKKEKRERQRANKETGVANMHDIAAGNDCPNFMQSQKLGNIAFYQGNESEGYLHIKNNPDKNHQLMLQDGRIPDTLAYGKYYEDSYKLHRGWSVVLGDQCVFLGSDGDGVKIITAYISKTKAAVFARRAAIENRQEV